ncbi:hypothetical protein WJX74_005667 [Apatococcus lobatus]|uniref:Uncharacterized protein n=1 Tax=Apatococcus lobatus TaxID=904363 RepID=A0AAW1QHZ1_9CHLO
MKGSPACSQLGSRPFPGALQGFAPFRASRTSKGLVTCLANNSKTAVVSGTGTFDGIGRACVREFLKQGYKVVGLDVNDPEDEQKDQVLQQHQGSYQLLKADLSKEGDVKDAISTATDFFGKQVNCIVNNAGLAIPVMAEDPSERIASYRKFLAVNLEGAFILAEACIPFMPAGHSSIINISSIRGKLAEPNTEGYTSSKAGMLGLTRAQAVSLDKKVRVNCVMPGWIDTPGSSAEITQDKHDWHLVGRAGDPRDIAHAVIFLADDEKAGFISGQELMVDGGVSAKLVYPE